MDNFIVAQATDEDYSPVNCSDFLACVCKPVPPLSTSPGHTQGMFDYDNIT